LTQKWEANVIVLEHIKNIFNKVNAKGSLVPHHAENIWELRINGVKNCKEIFNYFDEFLLNTKKKKSFLKWKLIHERLVKGDHLNDETRLVLLNLSKEINKR
jgi:hypothetical protein